MSKTKNLMKWLLILLLDGGLVAGGLVACTKGGTLADGGIGGTGVTQGPITSFGSIIVNGIRFDVSQAEIDINGEASDEELLQPGMVVTIYGDVSNDARGKAHRVVFEYNLKGVVDSILSDGIGFTAQGQTVRVDALTVFRDTHLENLTVGSSIYVSGVAGGEGILLARYLSNQEIIDRGDLGLTHSKVPTYSMAEFNSEGSALNANQQPFVEFNGEVSQLDTNQQRFTLGQQRVDYSLALFLNMKEGELANGFPIILKGYKKSEMVTATELKPHHLEVSTGQVIKLQGLVSELNGEGRFNLSSQRIIFSTQTQFVAGVAGDLVENIPVMVDGTFENGEIKARRIEFKSPSFIRIAAPIEAIQGSDLSLTGVPVRVLNTTLMLDSSSMALRRFSAANLALGDALIVHGYETVSGVELNRLERVNHLDQESITGAVEWVDNPTFGLLGMTVDTSAIEGGLLSRTLQPGAWVTVTGIHNASVFAARQVTKAISGK